MTEQRSTRSTNLDEAVYQRVFDAILEHRLAPGTRLNEAELAQIFGVSRTVIRRALVRLGHDDIVESRRNRGTWLATVDPAEARTIFEARKLIEAAIVRLACAKATRADTDELRALIGAEEEADAAGDHGRALRLSGEFHFKIAEIAANPPLAGFARKLISRVSLIIAQFETPGSTDHLLHGEHHELVDAIGAGDAERAEALMLEHVQHIEDKIDFNEVKQAASLREIFAGG